jgi:hypothetical protein
MTVKGHGRLLQGEKETLVGRAKADSPMFAVSDDGHAVYGLEQCRDLPLTFALLDRGNQSANHQAGEPFPRKRYRPTDHGSNTWLSHLGLIRSAYASDHSPQELPCTTCASYSPARISTA